MQGALTSAVRRLVPLALSGAFAVALGGCSPGDVELNGKVFNALGSLTGAGGGNEDVKVAARPGIVVPPNLQSLPQPGAEKVPEGQLAEIQDADAKKVVDKTALKAQQEAYCKEHYDKPKQQGDATVESVAGPMGPCRKSVLTQLGDPNALDFLNTK